MIIRYKITTTNARTGEVRERSMYANGSLDFGKQFKQWSRTVLFPNEVPVKIEEVGEYEKT